MYSTSPKPAVGTVALPQSPNYHVLMLFFLGGWVPDDKVNWELLIFFSGLFIVIEGLQKTDLPKAFLTAMLPYMSMNSVAGVCAFTAIIAVGCNVFSNVPMVLLVSLAKVKSRDGHPPELPFGAYTGVPFPLRSIHGSATIDAGPELA